MLLLLLLLLLLMLPLQLQSCTALVWCIRARWCTPQWVCPPRRQRRWGSTPGQSVGSGPLCSSDWNMLAAGLQDRSHRAWIKTVHIYSTHKGVNLAALEIRSTSATVNWVDYGSSPGMRVNTRYIKSTRGTSSNTSKLCYVFRARLINSLVCWLILHECSGPGSHSDSSILIVKRLKQTVSLPSIAAPSPPLPPPPQAIFILFYKIANVRVQAKQAQISALT